MGTISSKVLFTVCVAIGFQSAFAATIDQTGVTNGTASTNAVDLNLPGMPLPGYAFPWALNFFPADVSVSNAGSFDPGFGDQFLVTENTSFDFTGDLQLSIFKLNPSSGMDPSQLLVTSSAQSSPELGSGYMLLSAIGAMLACTGYFRLSAR